MNNLKNIWVFIETSDNQPKRVSLELLAKAQKLASEIGIKAIPVVYPDGSTLSAASISNGLKAAIEKESPALLLMGSTALGKDVSALLSASMNLGIASDCTDVMYRDTEQDFLFIRPTFDGKLYASISLKSSPQIGTFSTGTFPLEDDAPDVLENALTLSIDDSDTSTLKSQLLEFIQDSSLAQANIEEASVLVSGGKGLGSAEGFNLLRELAGLLGGSIAASRAAVDEGWISREYQVGATGKTVTPKIYFACGISGAVAHVAGMKDAETIIAINTDASAPIFDIAHYGIVGDLHKVIPELISIIKSLKG
ncbi:MAG: electron transfer flavoprotein subunit alpha/FixB family protein [Clostridia bacterium]|nr:electron transfer flavoprotein subunit alpha/FixB family protein [Lachnospiraceae bacterium]NCB99697.1 electron transfer flavoprotein subunit alpha/FixB family protein [Clostridia bacterium]NCD01730.1 electron transfer flavoprotein subunit alpha/FixB family protein [Clostridia bacterium]